MQNFTDDNPLVSICIPVYNGEKTIRKTLSSIINQEYKNIEIIVSDNCSTDSTVKIVREFQDPRLQLIINEVHATIGEENWNRCFQHAHGEFMAIFHADDIYLPHMVSRQVETFQKNPSIGGIFTQANLINENDEITGTYKNPIEIKKSEPYTYEEIINLILVHGDFLLCPSAMIRTDLYKYLAPFRFSLFTSSSDLDMWLRLVKSAPIMILDEKLMNYRISKTQGSYLINQQRTKSADFFRVMDAHIRQMDNNITISPHAKNRYNISRFGDQLYCIRNSFLKKAFKECSHQIKQVEWLKIMKIIMNNPQFINLKFLKNRFKK